MEVRQGVQDLSNRIPENKWKQTYVVAYIKNTRFGLKHTQTYRSANVRTRFQLCLAHNRSVIRAELRSLRVPILTGIPLKTIPYFL